MPQPRADHIERNTAGHQPVPGGTVPQAVGAGAPLPGPGRLLTQARAFDPVPNVPQRRPHAELHQLVPRRPVRRPVREQLHQIGMKPHCAGAPALRPPDQERRRIPSGFRTHRRGPGQTGSAPRHAPPAWGTDSPATAKELDPTDTTPVFALTGEALGRPGPRRGTRLRPGGRILRPQRRSWTQPIQLQFSHSPERPWADRVRAAARASGLGDGFSGHSEGVGPNRYNSSFRTHRRGPGQTGSAPRHAPPAWGTDSPATAKELDPTDTTPVFALTGEALGRPGPRRGTRLRPGGRILRPQRRSWTQPIQLQFSHSPERPWATGSASHFGGEQTKRRRYRGR